MKRRVKKPRLSLSTEQEQAVRTTIGPAAEMTQDLVVDALRAVQGNQTLTSFASSIGYSTAYLSDIYNCRRYVGPDLLDALGLDKRVEKRVVYTKRWR